MKKYFKGFVLILIFTLIISGCDDTLKFNSNPVSNYYEEKDFYIVNPTINSLEKCRAIISESGIYFKNLPSYCENKKVNIQLAIIGDPGTYSGFGNICNSQIIFNNTLRSIIKEAYSNNCIYSLIISGQSFVIMNHKNSQEDDFSYAEKSKNIIYSEMSFYGKIDTYDSRKITSYIPSKFGSSSLLYIEKDHAKVKNGIYIPNYSYIFAGTQKVSIEIYSFEVKEDEIFNIKKENYKLLKDFESKENSAVGISYNFTNFTDEECDDICYIYQKIKREGRKLAISILDYDHPEYSGVIFEETIYEYYPTYDRNSLSHLYEVIYGGSPE